MNSALLPVGFRLVDSETRVGMVAEIPKPQRSDKRHELAQLVRTLGLGDAYAERFNLPILEIDPRPWAHTQMTADQWLIFQTYFPTRYGAEGRSMEKFDFEEIPEPVLNLWREAKASGFFHSFQIRTTEGQGADAIASLTGQLDPVLIGFWLDKTAYALRPYLLARWGVDSPANLNMSQIARRVRRICLMRAKRYVPNTGLANLLALFMAIGSASLAFYLSHIPIAALHIDESLGWMASLCIGVLVYLAVGLNISGLFQLMGSHLRRWWLMRHGFVSARLGLRKQLEKIAEAAAAKRIIAAGV